MRPATSWRTTASIRAPCSTISVTATYSTPCGTASCRPIGSTGSGNEGFQNYTVNILRRASRAATHPHHINSGPPRGSTHLHPPHLHPRTYPSSPLIPLFPPPPLPPP